MTTDRTLEESLAAYCEAADCTHFEGLTGVANLETVLGGLGYRDLLEFLADNPGAIEAILTWIGETNLPEWTASLEEALTEEEFARDN